MNRVTARVIGCLSPGTIDVVLCPGAEVGTPVRIPIELAPPECRFPNREFIAVMDGCIMVDGERLKVAPAATHD